MIFCETGSGKLADFDALAVFVSQARGCGVPAVISTKSVPTGLRAAHQFDAAPFLTDAAVTPQDTIIIIDAMKIDATRASDLRNLAGGQVVKSIAFGDFPTRQSEITIASRLAFALNVPPLLSHLNSIDPLPVSNIPIFAAPLNKAKRMTPVIGVFVPQTKDSETRKILRMLQKSRHFDVEIVTTGDAKKNWIDHEGYAVPAWHLGELLPRALASRFDLAVMMGPPTSWARMQMLVANLCQQGTGIVDITADQAWSKKTPDIISGPSCLADLGDWLAQTIVPQLGVIAEKTTHSDFAAKFAVPAALEAQCPPPQSKRKSKVRSKGPVVFMPTNGVGLGHAKRCSLIADAMRNSANAQFAAFPSCIGMLTASGFDTTPLVSRAQHCAAHANDLMNFARLDRLAQDARAIVFDGGYVFDSIMRAAADNARPSIWIRRGLWQDGQNNQVALDRQKTFSRIVVPTEAFDELNGPPEDADNLRYVGPIVQDCQQSPKESRKLRQTLSKSLGLSGRKLVVTMLGGGVAADRRAQINAVCAHLEGRPNIMHLLVVWPTAKTDPAWFHYQNTRVVQSIHASVLIPMADVFISAVGYNSFHEAIYAKTPTVFIPQMAGFMDDQRARAKAAAERDLAILVEPWEMLTLTKAIDECLEDRGGLLRDNLRKLNLPATGAKAAAQHILECTQ